MKTFPFQFFLFFTILYSPNMTFGENNSSNFNILLFTESYLSVDDKKVSQTFADSLSSKLANTKFGIILPENIGPTQLELYNTGVWNEIRLARELEAKAILFANLDSYTKTRVDLPQFDRTVVTFKLSSNYRFISAMDGSSYAGENFEVEKKIPLTSKIEMTVQGNAILNELVGKTVINIAQSVRSSETLAKKIKSNISHVASPKLSSKTGFTDKNNLVEVQISAKLKNMTIPEMTVGKKGQLVVSGNNIALVPSDAEVEINGIVVGMCSDVKKLKIPAGLSKIRVRKPGFTVVERLINAYDGFSLTVTLEPTPKEYDKWQKQLRFLQEIKTGESLNQNQKLLAEGMFEFLKNSKYEVPKVKLN
jgi:hypothetical protein